MSDDNKEVMNDGCGRISQAMARDVANCLGLTYVPSGFQARFGGAKGFWIVELHQSTEPCIEIYTSQQKWGRSPDTLNPGDRDQDHRTFEVVGWVKPLKSATLNLQFLPILEDRGISKKKNERRNIAATEGRIEDGDRKTTRRHGLSRNIPKMDRGLRLSVSYRRETEV